MKRKQNGSRPSATTFGNTTARPDNIQSADNAAGADAISKGAHPANNTQTSGEMKKANRPVRKHN